jgi:hypothetical protein
MNAAKSLRVVLVLEYFGIDSPDSPEAQGAVEGVTEELQAIGFAYGADGAWIEKVSVHSEEPHGSLV